MPAITAKKVSEHIGAEVLGVDIGRLLADEDVPESVMDTLEANGVLLLRGLRS